MTFDIRKMQACAVGGLVLPGVEPGAAGQGSDLMMFTQERILARGLDEVVVVYVCNPEVGWSAVVGYRCDGVDDLAVGDSLVRVSEGYVAHFESTAERADAAEDVWRQVEVAEKEGQIERAFREETAVIRPGLSTELFISLA